MAIIPSDEPDFGIDSQTQAPDELTDDQLRAAAGRLELDFDTMNPEERDFVAIFARGQLDTQPPVVPGDVIEEDGASTPDPSEPPAEPTDDPEALATPGAESDEAGVGSAADGTGGGDGNPVAVTTPPAGVGAPGGGYEIPSPLPPVAPEPPQVQPAGEQPLVMLPDGTMVPLAVAMQIAQNQQQQIAQQQGQAPPPANPWDNGPTVPPAGQPQYPTTPFGTEYIDERAGAEIAQLRQGFDQLQQQTVAAQRMAQMQHEQAVGQAISETAEQYATARGLAPAEVEKLLDTATRLGSISQYGQMYPGDPRRAVGAALESAYWLTPEYRDREIEAQVNARTQEVEAVNAKKARAGQTTSPTGSVPRSPAPAGNRAERDAGMVAMIESALNGDTPTRR